MSFQRNQGPMMSGGRGVTFQLSMTKPTGSPSRYTARYQGLPAGCSTASSSESATDDTNRPCPGPAWMASTTSRFASVISRSSIDGIGDYSGYVGRWRDELTASDACD